MADKAGLQFSVTLDLPIFDPEIVVDEKDSRARRPVFAPWLPNLDSLTVPTGLSDQLWTAFQQEPETGTTSVQSDVVFIQAESDSGAEIIQESPPLKMVSYGRAIIKVYGQNTIRNKQGRDVLAVERLTVLDGLNPIGEVPEGKNLFEFKKEEWEKKSKHAWVSFKLTGKLGGRDYARTYLFPGNRGELSGQQVKYNGRKREWFKEVLTFNGDTEKRIKYWYMKDSVVYIRHFTEFVDEKGDAVARPRNSTEKDSLTGNEVGFGSPVINIHHKGTTFRSPVPCFGMMVIEYQVDYTEFEVLYDYPENEVTRSYRVAANRPQRLGYLTYDTQNVKKASGTTLPGVNFTGQRVLSKKEPGDPAANAMPYRIFPRVEFLPYRSRPLMLIYSNDKRSHSFEFTPPEPDFSDIPDKQLPRQAVFEFRRRYRIYPDGAGTGNEWIDYERVEECTYVTALGDLINEKSDKGG